MRLLLAVALLASGPARAEDAPSRRTPERAIDRLGDGAALYALLRPVAAATVLQRLGADKSSELGSFKQRFGVDLLDPGLLVPTGLDPAAPVAAALFEPVARSAFFHHRVVATLADPARFELFFSGVASGQKDPPILTYAPESPEARAGIRASMTLPEGGVAILRVAGEHLIVDATTPWEGKGPSALELARSFPLTARATFSAGAQRGARRLLAADAAAAVYVDGRRLSALMVPLALSEIRFGRDQTVADMKRRRAAARKAADRCASEWSRVPSVFDDLAVSLTVDAKGLALRLGFGTVDSAHAPLKLALGDDAPLDIDALSREATGSLSLRLTSLAPFQALKRGGPLAVTPPGVDAAFSSVGRCGTLAFGQVLVRHWPQLIGLLLDQASRGSPTQVAISTAVLGRLRNVHGLAREIQPGGATRYALAATFEPEVRPAIELVFTSAGPPTKLTFGDRKAVAWPLSALGGLSGTLALEELPSGKLLLVAADSSETLAWVYRPKAPLPLATPPVLSLHLDGLKLAALAGLFNLSRASSPLIDLVGRAGAIDGDVTDEPGLLLLTLRAPLTLK